MAVLTTPEQTRLNRALGHAARKLSLAQRLQYLETDGTFTGGTTGAGVRVTAGSGGITADFFVYVSDYDTTEAQFVVLPADAATNAKARDIFWCPTAIAATEFGYAYKQGAITAVNTNAGTVGDAVYLADASAGGWTLTEPTGTDRVRQIGSIAVVGTSDGVISVDLGGEAITVHDHADNAGGGTLSSIGGLTGTSNATFEVDDDTTNTSLILSAATSGGSTSTLTLIPHATFASDYSVTFPDPGGADEAVYVALAQTLTNKTLTTPTIAAAGWSNANHTHAGASTGGAIAASAAITGTTSSTFDIDSDSTGGFLQLSSTAGGAAYNVVLTNEITSGLSADVTVTIPADTTQLVGRDTTDTLTNKTLTAPVINAGTLTGTLTISSTPTISGTWTDLGIVTTVDINGGTIDGTAVGGSVAAAGAFTTIAASDDVTIAAGKDIVLAAGAGYIQVGAASSGSIIINPTGSTGYDVTLSTITQTTGTATLSIPNMNNVSDTIATLALVNAFTGANTHAGIETFASITGNDAALNITGTAGSGGAGGTLIVAGGAGDTNTAGGLVSSTGGAGNGTGAGGANSVVGGSSGSGAAPNGGAVDLTGGAGVGTGASDGGAATIISGATTNGTAGAVSIDTGAKGSGSAGAMTIAGTNCVAIGIGNAAATLTVTGALAMATDDNITLTSTGTNGFISLGGSVSGGIKLLPLATGTALTTITNQNVSAATITLPSATCTLPGLALSNTFSVEQTCAIDDANDDVRDALTLTHSSTGSASAGGGVALNFDLENAVAARVEKWASIHAISTDVTDGTEVGDLVLSTMLAGTVSPAVTIDASEGELVLGQATTLAAGVDRMRIWPVTASRGSLLIVAADNTGDDVVTLTNTNTTAARTLTLPDVTGTLAVIDADQVGYVELSGSVSGAIKVAPIATGTATTTIQNQNVSAAVITLPSATCTLGGLGLANTHTAVNTYGIEDAGTNTTIFPVVVNHTNTGGTAAAAFGVGLDFFLEDASDNDQSAGTIGVEWAVATHGSEDADMVFKVAIDDATVTEVMRLDSTANQLMLGPATGGSKCTGIKVHPATTAKGSLQFNAVDNNAADVAVVIQNGQSGAGSTFTLPTVASGVFAMTASADGTIAADQVTDAMISSSITKRPARKAWGAVYMTGVTVDEEILTIGGRTYGCDVAKDGVAGSTVDVELDNTTADEFVNKFAAAINGDAQTWNAVADTTNDILFIYAVTAGAAGNSITLAEAFTNGDVSGANLVDGADAAVAAIQTFRHTITTTEATGGATSAMRIDTGLSSIESVHLSWEDAGTITACTCPVVVSAGILTITEGAAWGNGDIMNITVVGTE